MFGEYTIDNNVRVTLTSAITSTATSITFNAATGQYKNLPNPSGDTASAGVGIATLIDVYANPTATEIITYTSLTNNGNGTYTIGGVTRGADGTTGVAWSAGATMIQSYNHIQTRHSDVTYNKNTHTLGAINATLSGTLGVTGAATFSSTLGVTGATTLGVLTVGGATLGSTAGSALDLVDVNSSSTNNDNLLSRIYRRTAGSSWSNAEWRLQRKVDTALQGFMAFDGSYGVSFGSGDTIFASLSNSGVFTLTQTNAGFAVQNGSSLSSLWGDGGTTVITCGSVSTRFVNSANGAEYANLSNSTGVFNFWRGAFAPTYAQSTYALGTVGSTASLKFDYTGGGVNNLTLTASTNCTISVGTAPQINSRVRVVVNAPAGGTVPTITWPASFKFAPGQLNNTTPNPGSTWVFEFWYDGTNYYACDTRWNVAPVQSGEYLYAGNNNSTSSASPVGKAGTGSYITWNYSGGSAEMDFINQSSGATGGWSWRKSDGTTITEVATLDASGNFKSNSIGYGAYYNAGATTSINWANSGMQYCSVSTNATLSYSNVVVGQIYVLVIKNTAGTTSTVSMNGVSGGFADNAISIGAGAAVLVTLVFTASSLPAVISERTASTYTYP